MNLIYSSSHERLLNLFNKVPLISLQDDSSWVIFSDLHMGNGHRSDDFAPNALTFKRILEGYALDGWTVVLNGDIEELLRFPQSGIEQCWESIYQIFEQLHGAGRLYKLFGNHDMALEHISNLRIPVLEGLRLGYHGEQLFLFHGHQVSDLLNQENHLVNFVLKYIATPLGIRNFSVRHDSRKKYYTERSVYDFSAKQGIISIIGHTHRPLFESMSKYDNLRFEIERLCRKFPKAKAKRQAAIRHEIAFLRNEMESLRRRKDKQDYQSSLYQDSLVVPCIFNSGTIIGKHGMTCIELAQGKISLIHYFEQAQNHAKIKQLAERAEAVPNTSIYKRVVKSDSLDWIFSRIQLLGNMEDSPNSDNTMPN